MLSALRKNESQWTTTYNGIRFNLENPKEKDVLIDDIAHSLAKINRFNGHHKFEHYSVAQHSILVSNIIGLKYGLAGLLHDASEAYLQDIITPVKYLIREAYIPLEEKVMRVIFSKFEIDYSDVEMWERIKWADEYIFACELRDIKNTDERRHHNLSIKITPGDIQIKIGYFASQAKVLFLERFNELLSSYNYMPKQEIKDK